jgi:hypothetical protein
MKSVEPNGRSEAQSELGMEYVPPGVSKIPRSKSVPRIYREVVVR